MEDTGTFEELDNDQIDALQEIGNIGSGHAANALADLLNRKIDMSLPRFSMLSKNEFKSWSKSENIVAVTFCPTKGDLLSEIIVVLSEETIKNLLKIINKDFNNKTNISELGVVDKSTILEIGSILSLHYLTAINTFLSMKSFPETPYLILDKAEMVLNRLVSDLKIDKIMLIECDVFTTDYQLKPIVIFVPHPKSVQKTINAMFGF